MEQKQHIHNRVQGIDIFHGKAIDFSLIPDITQDDVAFLSNIFERFPRVANGYHDFTNTPPDKRIPKAMKVLETQPRTGWALKFNELPKTHRAVADTYADEYKGKRHLISESSAPSTETVLEHSAEANELFKIVYGRSLSKARLQWGMEGMKFHDFHEAIDGDFTPNCAITKDEKKRLEAISTNLLCEARHDDNLHTLHVHNCTQIFEGHVTDANAMREQMVDAITTQRKNGMVKPDQEPAVDSFSKLYSRANPIKDVELLQQQLNDIDALHMAVRSCRMVKESHIKPENKAKMEEFWNYIDKKLKTPEAKSFFTAIRTAYLDDSQSYQMALESAAKNVSNSPAR